MPERIAAIIGDVSFRRGVTFEEIVGLSRNRRVAWARMEAAFLIRKLTFPDGRPPSFPRIGRWLNRDHTTIYHAVNRWPVVRGLVR